MIKNSSIYVAGHKGMVGSAIIRSLKNSGYKNIITSSSSELDLRIQFDVENFFQNTNLNTFSLLLQRLVEY